MNLQRKRFRNLLWLCVLVAILLSIAVAYQKLRVLLAANTTMKNLQLIMLALEDYRQAKGSYPPEYLKDERGRPAHSWRGLLLPYLGCDDLYRRYSFSEPWNGPHNRLLADEIPEVYKSPFIGSGSTTTQYVGVSGERTAWWDAAPLSAGPRRDGTPDSCVWFAEISNSDIGWMEPRDFPIEDAIGPPGRRGIQSNYPGVLPVQMTSGSRKWIELDMPREKFRALFQKRRE
jgi:hypothetical protein